MPTDYSWLLNTPTRSQWTRIGTQRRAGVIAPLFSLHSQQSQGIGDLLDLMPLIDWCREAKISIIQLLPLNDMGYDFAPYGAQSTLALDPIYLSLTSLEGVTSQAAKREANKVRKAFPCTGPVRYQVKRAKLASLRTLYETRDWKIHAGFQKYRRQHKAWLEAFTAFKVLKDHHDQKAWTVWPKEIRQGMNPKVKQRLKAASDELQFQAWLQWQLAVQFQQVKAYATEKQVWLMGDLPFLVAKDSADVWAHPEYFKLELSAGAPPDMYFSQGQRWGTPPYAWEAIAQDAFQYLAERLQYAEQFYDLYRIDHFVGIFRLWTIPLTQTQETGGLVGAFDPSQEAEWEGHGRWLLDVMLANSQMLPCAEDLGTVPVCSERVLAAYGIVGTDVQRWAREWRGSLDFRSPESLRPNGMVTLSTHDSSNFQAWWEYEIGTVDEALVRRKSREKGYEEDWVIGQLFDPTHSRYGRLHWRSGLTLEGLGTILGRPLADLYDFTEMYRSTYDERERYLKHLGLDPAQPAPFTTNLAQRMLESVGQSRSIFCVHLLQDWLQATPFFRPKDAWTFRINWPGTTGEQNWSLRLPFSLEALNASGCSQNVRKINVKNERE